MTELLIGRESKENRLQLTLGSKVGVYGTVGSVPQSISRRHCILTIDDEKDTMKLSICKDSNQTYVNGVSIVVSTVNIGDVVELGFVRYRINWDFIMDFINKNKASLPKTADVRELENIWEKYKKQQSYYQAREKFTNLARSITPILTIGSVFLERFGIKKYAIVIVVIFLIVLTAISFYDSLYNIPRKRDKLNKKMIDEYTCPNCHYYFGSQPYEVIKANLEVCPRCKAKLIK